MTAGRTIGLIAGNGRFPFLFAEGARQKGARVVVVAHRGETDPALEQAVSSFTWVYIGQFGKMVSAFRKHGVTEAAMAGGIGKLKAFKNARPDWKGLAVIARMRHFQDDGLLSGIAAAFEAEGIKIIPSTEFLADVLAPKGLLAGRGPTSDEQRDIELGREVATAIGRADLGQTVVVRRGIVIAVEAAEGTDACIRRAGELAGEGIVVVKRCKPGQDQRFDLPAVGPETVRTLAAAGGKVLAIEAGKTIVIDGAELSKLADALGISVAGV